MKQLPLLDFRGAVYAQKPYCDSAFCGHSDDHCILNSKVFLPTICPGIKQRRKLSRFGVQGGDIAALEAVAKGAAESEIAIGGFRLHV